MGIVLTYPTFVSGTARSGAEVQVDLEDVRKWLNGQVAPADIQTGACAAKHLLSTEHYGSPLNGSLGVTMDCFYAHADMGNEERAIFRQDVGSTQFVSVPELSRTFHLERESHVLIAVRYFAWSAFAYGGVNVTQLTGVVGFSRLYIDNAGIATTTRRITLSDLAASPSPEDKKEHSIHHWATLAAGYHDIYVGIRALPHGNGSPVSLIDDALPTPFFGTNCPDGIHVQVRSFRIEASAFAA